MPASSDDQPRSAHIEDEWGFREYFLLGALLGFIYSLFRYPGTLGCIALVVLVLGAVLVFLYWKVVLIGLAALVILHFILKSKRKNRDT